MKGHRIKRYRGVAPGWYVWRHDENAPNTLVFLGRYRTRAKARVARDYDRKGLPVPPGLPPEKSACV